MGAQTQRNHQELPCTDDQGSQFVIKSIHHGLPIVVNTPLVHACDYLLITGAAGTVQTVSVLLSESKTDGTDPNGGVLALTLACNVWHELAVLNVTALGGGSAFAGYIRRPAGT